MHFSIILFVVSFLHHINVIVIKIKIELNCFLQEHWNVYQIKKLNQPCVYKTHMSFQIIDD